MKLDLRKISAFSELNDSNIEKLNDESELLKFPIGHSICTTNLIPDKTFLIVKGQARFIHRVERNIETIAKIGPGNFIGLASILRTEGCEEVAASNEVIAAAIPDKLILEIYQKETSFRKWCNNNIQFGDIYAFANHLLKSQSKQEYNIKELVKVLINKISLISIENGKKTKYNDEITSLIASGNFIGHEFFQTIDDNFIAEIRGPLSGRVIQIPKNIYLELTQNSNQKTLKKVETKIDLGNDIKNAENQSYLSESIEKIGQYNPDKKFKVIRAKGEIRESLACLNMLASDLNLPYRVDAIEKILRDHIKRGKKPSLEIMGSITSMMGLHTVGAKVDAKLANRLPTPSLIVWKNNFAIVKESHSNYLKIISPSEGLITLKPEQFENSFKDGVIQLLTLDKHDQTPEAKFGIKWLLPSLNRYKGVLTQVLLASFVVQLFGLANPLMIQIIIDKVINQRSLDTLQILGFALVVITILGGLISSLRTFLFAETTNRIDTRLGAEVIDHLLRIPLNYFDRRPVGELGSRIAELEKIRNFLTGQALTTILDAAFSLIYIVVMVIYSWLLTLIALGVVPIQIMLTLIGTPLIRGQIREIAQENAKTQSHLVEVLTGIQTVKAQNVERVSRWKWQELYSKYISKSFQKTITGTALGETSQVLQQISQLLVLWIGATLVLKGQLTLGQLIAFRIISGYVTQPLLRLSTIWQNVQELRVSFERLGDIVDTPEESSESDKEKIPLPTIQGSVVFDNVDFSFNPGQPQILKKINLKIKTGQFVGVVGQSGSGKSTLMKLLPRLYKPQSGKILIDNYDIDKVELYSLRRQIGIVPQEPLLFAGNINTNIALTDPEATSEEIVKAAKIANAHDFIMQLKDGYSTHIGERGAGLSGGQKQRIAIARTLLSNPKLLIMDEATSALDYETERKVCEGLRSSSTGSTVFFITHRLTTVKNSDVIVMLHEGSIVEMGTHEELMEKKGRYFALYCQQESS